MPELPEVETVRRVLAPQLAGRRITAVKVFWPGVVAHPAVPDFVAAVQGQVIAGLERRGKYLSLPLQSGALLRLHLRMTGQLLVTPPAWPALPYTHLAFSLDDGCELRFADMRRFGRFWLLGAGEADLYSGIGKLGPEPFDPALTPAYLQAALGRRTAAIKSCLLDQRVVAGIGNIYGDEILFEARIRPDRPANSLTAAQYKRLAAAIPACLARYVEWNAISAADYLAGAGQDYRDTPYLRVYGRSGTPCLRCGRAGLRRVVLAGRSSCYCPRCQK